MTQLFDYGTLYDITVETKRNMLSQKVLILFRTVNMDLSEVALAQACNTIRITLSWQRTHHLHCIIIPSGDTRGITGTSSTPVRGQRDGAFGGVTYITITCWVWWAFSGPCYGRHSALTCISLGIGIVGCESLLYPPATIRRMKADRYTHDCRIHWHVDVITLPSHGLASLIDILLRMD
ncbi:hypothetical protein L1987_77766 [Smallanthus sonchifolius]|uniref:Uncharacterized protein n=1 Tax=Smallanthus sonchifolius TaxID=185202 RepID=A0ACB8ZBA6_9ASTR|nr:hypothetical protein L1987_77766 [Smallanthus sonchifolius]